MRYFICLFLVVVFASCAGVRVRYDYNEETDFSSYTTYNYFSDMESGLSELDERRLLRVLDSTLQSRGYMLSEEPDFFVNIISEEFRNVPQNNVGFGIGGTGGNVGGGISVGVPMGTSQLKRRILFDFVDSQRDYLFWQGSSETNFRQNLSPVAREELLRKVVLKVFSKFPPK